MKRFLNSFGFAAASLVTTVYSLATFEPIDNGPIYSVGIPSDSSISASSTGGIYIQLNAPSTYQWAGFGIGAQMAGARVFIMYADGNGNVTVSARDGAQGHVQPLLDEGLQSGVTLLAGSGIVGDRMIANVRCDKSTLETSKDDTASPFIAAWMPGNPLDSTSLSATIRQHSGNAFRQFTFDLSDAAISTDANPFLSTSSGSSSSDSDDSGDDSVGDATVFGISGETLAKYQKAHGIIMGVTVVLLFPLGAMFMRLGGSAWGHGILQLISLCALIAGFGLGIRLAQITDYLYNTTHTIFGTVIVSLFVVQPLLGIIHHVQYSKSGTRNPVSHIHIWYGRIIMALGIVNGGLGLKLAANTNGGKIAYGVVAGGIAVLYALLVVFRRKGVTNVDGTRRNRWGGREKVRDGGS